MTPYLTDEWLARWKKALDEAKKLDMNTWIYDENSFPSGFAGGLVPDASCLELSISDTQFNILGNLER